jgi:hypothetical protein
MGLKLIGVHGKARSGKDTVARILGDEHGFVRTAFADPLKAASAVLFGWPVDLAFSDEIKGYKSPLWNDLTGREIFQKFGTEAMRGTFGDDFWIKRWACDYSRLRKKHSIVVSDVRTNIEADMIRGLGGLILHVERRGAGLSGLEAFHSSERGIIFNKGTDLRLENNGTLEELEDEVHRIVAFIEVSGKELGFRNEVEEG